MKNIAKFRCGFYYQQLSIDQQFGYRLAASAIANYDDHKQLNTCSEKDIHRILLAVKYDNPEFFYWVLDETIIAGTDIRFVYSTKERKEAASLVQMTRAKRRAILDDLMDEEAETTQEQILRKLYSYVVTNVEYADSELQQLDCPQWIYDIQGPLLKERGVCLGIAQMVNYFCEQIHIPSILVTGEAVVNGRIGNHAWNIVQIDSSYYHLDATSELENEERSDQKYQYFMCSDERLKDRKWSKTTYPECAEQSAEHES